MSPKRKGKAKAAAATRAVPIKYEEIDPNNQLKADCGSELHDEIINIPHTFRTAGKHARAKMAGSATGQKLPRIGSRDVNGLVEEADHPILRKMRRDQKQFAEGSLLGEMDEISAYGRQAQDRRRNAKSVVKAAQELSGLDGGFEVFLDRSTRKEGAAKQSLRRLGGRPLASHATTKTSPVLRLVENQHMKIKQNLAKASHNQDHEPGLPDQSHSPTKSKDQLLSSINEDATKANTVSIANPKTEAESRISIPDNHTVKHSPMKGRIEAKQPISGALSRNENSPIMSLKALHTNESQIGGISSIVTHQRNDLQKYIKQQQYFRDTHTSRTANSKEGRRQAFVEYKQQMNEHTVDRPQEYSQPSVGDIGAAESSKIFKTVKEHSVEGLGTPEHASRITRKGSQLPQGRDEITVKGSIIGSGSGSLHQTPQIRAKKTHFQYRNRSVIPSVAEGGPELGGTIQPHELHDEALGVSNAQLNLARRSEMIAGRLRGSHFGKQTIDNTTDFESFNISALRSMKNAKLARCTKNIADVHARLMSSKQVSNQSADLTTIQKSLSPFFRQFFLTNQKHEALVSDMNYLNRCFIDVIDYACSYRIELGNSLQCLVESYNSIFLQQFQTFYENKLQKEKDMDKAMLEHQNEVKKLEATKQRVEEERQVRMLLLADKEKEIEALRESQRSLEQQIDELQKMLHKDELDTKKLAKELEDNKANLSKSKRDKGLHMEDNYTAKQRDYIAKNFQANQGVLFNPEYTKDLAVAISTAEEQMDDKQKVLRDMQLTFRKIMKNNSVNRSVQTSEAIWNDLPQRLKYHHSDDGSSEEEDGEDSQNSAAKERKKQEARDARFEAMKEERKIVIEEESQIPQDLANNLSPIQESGNEGDASQQPNKLKKSASQVILQSSSIKVTEVQQNGRANEYDEGATGTQTEAPGILDHPQISYNRTLRQNGLRSPGQLQVLHDEFLKICERVRLKHKDQNAVSSRQHRGEWKIPYTIIAFCANRIKELIENPQQVSDWQLVPWKKFKELLYVIYKHRIEHSPEINGSSNLNYCCMNEHVLIYFVGLLKERKPAEERLVELIINLRYYYDHWSRARMFAANLQLVHSEPEKSAIVANMESKESEPESDKEGIDEYGDDKAERADDPPQGFTGDNEVPENDLYVQEFFLHCFATLIQAEDSLVESAKGASYLRLQDHDRFAKQLVGTLRGPSGNLTRWKHKMKALVTRIPIEGLDIDFLDIDQVLGALVTEFKDQKRSYQNRLKKEFVRKLEGYTAACGFEEFQELIEAAEMGGLDDDQFIDPLISFTGPISQMRAYIFCLTAGESNTNTFSNEQFIAGLARYGIENPTPCVSKRLGMYGNSEDIMRALMRAEAIYGKKRMRIHTKRYSGAKNVTAKAIYGKVTHLDGKDSALTNESKAIEPEAPAEKKLAILPDPNAAQLKPYAHREKLASMTNLKFELVGAMNAKVKGQDPGQEAENKEAEKEANRYFVFHGATIKVQNLKDFRATNAPALEQKLLKQQSPNASPAKVKKRQPGQDVENEQLKLQKQRSSALTPDLAASKTGLPSTQKLDLTQIQYAMSHKQILVPTMGSLGAVFSQHLNILQDLRDRIGDLQQAYFQQKDPERTWKEVDDILLLLRNGAKFLDFPEEMVAETMKAMPSPSKQISVDVLDEDDAEHSQDLEASMPDSDARKKVNFGKDVSIEGSDVDSKSNISANSKEGGQSKAKGKNQSAKDPNNEAKRDQPAPALLKKQSRSSKKILDDSDLDDDKESNSVSED